MTNNKTTCQRRVHVNFQIRTKLMGDVSQISDNSGKVENRTKHNKTRQVLSKKTVSNLIGVTANMENTKMYLMVRLHL